MKEIKKRVLVTSGPTRAYFDRIRYIANTSSGALGARIVEALVRRDIPVIHIFGTGSLTPVVGSSSLLKSVEVVTVDDLIESLRVCAESEEIEAVVHAMAVLDYVPESEFAGKKSSGDSCWDIHLVKTPKVIGLMKKLFPHAYSVAFKLETGISDDELVNRAGALQEAHGLDLVVANLIEHVSAHHHKAIFIEGGRNILSAFSSKEDIANGLADCIAERM